MQTNLTNARVEAQIAEQKGEAELAKAREEAKQAVLAEFNKTRDDLTKHIAAETAKWQKVVKESGAKID